MKWQRHQSVSTMTTNSPLLLSFRNLLHARKHCINSSQHCLSEDGDRRSPSPVQRKIWRNLSVLISQIALIDASKYSNIVDVRRDPLPRSNKDSSFFEEILQPDKEITKYYVRLFFEWDQSAFDAIKRYLKRIDMEVISYPRKEYSGKGLSWVEKVNLSSCMTNIPLLWFTNLSCQNLKHDVIHSNSLICNAHHRITALNLQHQLSKQLRKYLAWQELQPENDTWITRLFSSKHIMACFKVLTFLAFFMLFVIVNAVDITVEGMRHLGFMDPTLILLKSHQFPLNPERVSAFNFELQLPEHWNSEELQLVKVLEKTKVSRLRHFRSYS